MESLPEKILVCVSSSPSSAGLIRYAGRMAEGLRAKWLAVYVESAGTLMRPELERSRALDNLRLAEGLGAETHTLSGGHAAEEIVTFARRCNVTRIVVGKPGGSRLKSIFLTSPVDRLVRIGGKIAIEAVAGEPGEPVEARYTIRPQKLLWSDYGTGILYWILATVLCYLMFPYFDLSNLIMVYLLGVLATALDCGRKPGVLVSALSVLSFDFCFVPPRYSFNVNEVQYFVTFAVMFVVALAISHLATQMRNQTEIARLQERQAAAMHGLSRQLAASRGVDTILKVAVQYFSEIFGSQVVALLPEAEGRLKVAAGDAAAVFQQDVARELQIACSAYETGLLSGWGVRDAPQTEVLFAPMQAGVSTLGVLAVRPADPERFLLPEQRGLLESLAKQVALALEVEHLTANGECDVRRQSP